MGAKKTWIAISIVVATGIGLSVAIKSSRSPSVNKSLSTHPKATKAGEGRGGFDRERHAKKEVLVGRWSKYRVLKGPSSDAERQKLLDDTVNFFLAKGNLPEVLDLLSGLGMHYEVSLIDIRIKDLFVGEFAREAREALIFCVGQSAEHLWTQDWCNIAGRGVSSDLEAEEFLSSIADDVHKQEAQIGILTKMAARNPEKALIKIVSLLGEGVQSRGGMEALKQLIKNLPASADYAELERLLPLDARGPWESAVANGRNELFAQWAQTDPAAAANYILENPQRVQPRDLASVVGVVVNSDPQVGLKWIEAFPQGEYFDSALYGSISYIAQINPGEAMRLIDLMQDQELKNECAEIARGFKSK